MRKIYVAKDGTEFNSAQECFNHEWREFFPNVKVFDYLENLVSDVTDAETIRIHDRKEYDFVCNYLREIAPMDYIPDRYLDERCDGVICCCDSDPEFVGVTNVCKELELYKGDDSDLAMEFEDYLLDD